MHVFELTILQIKLFKENLVQTYGIHLLASHKHSTTKWMPYNIRMAFIYSQYTNHQTYSTTNGPVIFSLTIIAFASHKLCKRKE